MEQPKDNGTDKARHPSAPKYQRLIEILTVDIQTRKYPSDSLLPSEHALASQYRVSRHTVRAALAHLESQGYLSRMRGKGTFVQYPPLQVDDLKAEIGILVPCVTISLYPEVVRGVEELVNESGRHLIIGCYDVDPAKERQYVTRMLEKPVAGMILCPSYNSSATLYQPLIHHGVPFVLVDTAVDGIDSDLVATNGFTGAREGMRRLVKNGCRTPAFISGYLSASTSRERLAGYRAAMDEADLPCREAYILNGDFSEAFGHEAIERLLALPTRPDGLLIANDPIAVGIVKGLREADVAVPKEMQICVFDEPNLPLHLRVPLTVIRQPRRAIGTAAARMLFERIEARARRQPCPPPRTLKLDPEIGPCA